MFRFSALTLGTALTRIVIASPVADPADALITPSPILHRRDYAPNFVGYALWDNGETDIYTCGIPYTYTSSDGYAGCCSGTCDVEARCNGAYLTYFGGLSTTSCPQYCITQFVYYATNDPSPAWLVQCDETSNNLKILRTSTLNSAAGPVTIQVTVTPTVRPSPSTPTTLASSSSATTPPLPLQTSSPKKNNAPIIGGAVGGVLVLLGLVALGLFIFLRKRPSNSSSAQGPTGGFGQLVQPQATDIKSNTYPPQPPAQAMSQPYTSPVLSPVISPVMTPPPQSPPPVYGQPAFGQEKFASVTMTTVPVPVQQVQQQQYEHRLPEGAAEVHGFSTPESRHQGSHNGASELA